MVIDSSCAIFGSANQKLPKMQHFSVISSPPQTSALASLAPPATTGPVIRQFLFQFDKEIDGLVFLYLLSIAKDGRVCESGYAMARQLGLFRTSLSRILTRLERQHAITVTVQPDSNGIEKRVIVLAVSPSPQQTTVTSEMATVTSEMATVTSEMATVTSEMATVTSETATVTSEMATVTSEMATVTSEMATVTSVVENVVPDAEIVTPSCPPATEGWGGVSAGKTLCDSGKVEDDGERRETGDSDAIAVGRDQKKKNKEEKSPVTPKEENKIKNTHPHTRETTLEQRRQAFVDSLIPFIDRYGRAMIQAFADYWTEPNHSLTRMRFEMQRTWSLPLRLATWARNDRLFAQRTMFQRPSSAECVAQAQQWAMEESERLVREAQQTQQREQRLRDHGIIVDEGEVMPLLQPF